MNVDNELSGIEKPNVEVKTSPKDVIWSYACTILTPISGFILLPILLIFLSDTEIGLWYVFIAISGWPSLLFLGLSPAFARNIVYCISGASALSKSGSVEYSAGRGINWHLLKCVMKTSKLFYACIACVTLLLLLSAGTIYIENVTSGSDISAFVRDFSWALFCLAMMLNVYFQYADVYLRGFGDIAATSRAQVLAKVSQLMVTPLLLFMGLGLIGAAFGFLFNSVAYRLLTSVYARKHYGINKGLRSDSTAVSLGEIKATFATIFYLAWRDGVVMISLYIATQVSTLICSAYLSLEDAGSYAILLQFANAICSFASAYAASAYPEFQAAYTRGDSSRESEIAGKCSIAYWAACFLCVISVAAIALPLLKVLKPEYTYDLGLFILLSVYTVLLNHHSMYCSFIMCMNEIPYTFSYLISSVVGLALSVFMIKVLGIGAWGLVIGQGIAQLAYNNWHWPCYVAHKLNSTYRNLISLGVRAFRLDLSRAENKI